MKPDLVQSASFWQTHTLFTHLPNPPQAASSTQPPPEERQYFLPLSSTPEHVAGAVHSPSLAQVLLQLLKPESVRQSCLGSSALQSAVVAHCGDLHALLSHV